jgi:outer membrane protein TolC
MRDMKLSFVTLSLLLGGLASAQQKPKQDSIYQFSIKQSIAYALAHQANVVNAKYEVDKAGYKVKEIVGIGLPQVSASGSVEDFLKIPTTLIPAQFFGGPAGTFEPVRFGTQYNSSGEIDASQLLFDGTYIVGLEASSTYKQLSQKSLTQTSIQTVSMVTKAYYTVLVNHWKHQMVDADAKRLKALMDETEKMYQTGFVEKLDWERIKVNYNNLKAQEEDIGRYVTLSYKLLKFQMGMAQKDSLALTDSLKSVPLNASVALDTAFKPEDRIEFSIMQTQLRASQLMLQKDRYSTLPSLALFGSYSESEYGTQFELFNSGQSWYPTAIVGLKLNIPIISGGQRFYRMQQDKIGVKESETQMDMVKQSISLDIANSTTSLLNALADLKNQEGNMTLAQNVEHDTKIKYEAGTGSNIEVVDAETSLIEAETNYYNALFNALVATVDYQQAKGTLYK